MLNHKVLSIELLLFLFGTFRKFCGALLCRFFGEGLLIHTILSVLPQGYQYLLVALTSLPNFRLKCRGFQEHRSQDNIFQLTSLPAMQLGILLPCLRIATEERKYRSQPAMMEYHLSAQENVHEIQFANRALIDAAILYIQDQAEHQPEKHEGSEFLPMPLLIKHDFLP